MDPESGYFLHLTYLLLALCLFVGNKAAHAAASTDAEAKSKVIAVVNGREITQEALSRYEKHRGIPHDGDPEQQRKMMLEELINRELIYLDAIKQGVDKNPQVQAEIQNQSVNIIASAMLKQTSETINVSDEELKKEYDAQVKNMDAQEFKARHILLESEADAKAVIDQLNKGADFAGLAKEKSTGPSGPNGGDLGWFKSDQMVPEFSAAVAKLEKGKFSQTPVKTQFGWHVVLKEDSRALEPPPFDSLKDQLRMRLINARIESYINSLRTGAKIERN